MYWLTVAALGACGGAIVSLVGFAADVFSWQQARRAARASTRHKAIPKLSQFIDPCPDFMVLLTRAVLGAIAAGLFHAQVSGVQAAVAVGATAPALLSQFGSVRAAKDIGIQQETGPDIIGPKVATEAAPSSPEKAPSLAEDG